LYEFLLEVKKNGDRMKLDSNKRTDDALGFYQMGLSKTERQFFWVFFRVSFRRG
jgi:hypothetical protein